MKQGTIMQDFGQPEFLMIRDCYTCQYKISLNTLCRGNTLTEGVFL